MASIPIGPLRHPVWNVAQRQFDIMQGAVPFWRVLAQIQDKREPDILDVLYLRSSETQRTFASSSPIETQQCPMSLS